MNKIILVLLCVLFSFQLLEYPVYSADFSNFHVMSDKQAWEQGYASDSYVDLRTYALSLNTESKSSPHFLASGLGDPSCDMSTSLHPSLSQATSDLKWELTGLLGGITYLGLKEWNWGSASFKFNDEGWFGMDSGNGGADKFGHLYSSYVIDEFLTNRLFQKSGDMHYSAQIGALYSFGFMLFVELFDGFSADHGFSYEDLIMNTAGIGVSYLKNTVPVLTDKLDLRIEYRPSEGSEGFHPITDYSGMKYLAVAKLAGFDYLAETPLKFIELQVGYLVRGFKEEDSAYFDEKTSEVFAGIGIDLQEVLFRPILKKYPVKPLEYMSTFFRYYQAPGTYKSFTVDKRKAALY